MKCYACGYESTNIKENTPKNEVYPFNKVILRGSMLNVFIYQCPYCGTLKIPVNPNKRATIGKYIKSLHGEVD